MRSPRPPTSGKAVALEALPRPWPATQTCADAAVLPRGGVAYLSGQPDEGGLTESAVTRSMSNLMKTLGHLKLSPAHVVQVKVFLRPVTSADEVLREVQKFFPGQLTPPVVFVEWLAAVPVEIEMIAQLPPVGQTGRGPSNTSPRPRSGPRTSSARWPWCAPSGRSTFPACSRESRAAASPRPTYVFEQLQEILAKTGSDMRHLVKATYYVCDDDAARWIDRTRPAVFDPTRPPAASKVMVHGMGQEGRTHDRGHDRRWLCKIDSRHDILLHGGRRRRSR